MEAEKDIIVALELATSAIRAIAGQRMPDGTMQVLAYAEENASNCIRKGIIDNIDKTTQAISRVIGQIGLQLGNTISRVYVGLSGQSLHSVQNKIHRHFNEKTQITNSLIDQLMDTNSGVVYTDSEILEVIPQEYKVGNRAIPDVVGMQVEQMEANYLNIIARNCLAENIDKCVKGAGYDIAELLITPLALGDSILTPSEKRSGCALVDLGADTTTVNVYTNNILRKMVVIPIGSNNVTLDIANCLNTEPEEAESLKIKYGRAHLEDYETAQHNIISLSHSREVNEERLCDIVEARVEEILRNAWAQIEDDCDKLTSGIIFTGGGAQIRSLTEAFLLITNQSRQIRIVKGHPTDIAIAPGIYVPDNGRANNILALLLHGDQNCIIVTNKDEGNETNFDTETNKANETLDTSDDPDTNNTNNKTEDEDEEIKAKQNRTRKFWDKIKDALSSEE